MQYFGYFCIIYLGIKYNFAARMEKIIDSMRMKKIIVMAVASLLTGCQTAPRVIAELTEQYPARQADSVMVYELGEPVPAEAKVIGTVRVTDGGLTPTYDCLYGNMLSLAVRKTAESGGNALRIDQHKEPSAWSSTCHRIWGSMLLLPDSLVSIDAVSAIQKAELNQDAELANMARDQINRHKRAVNNPKNIFSANIGYGIVTSKICIDWREYKNKGGLSADLGYQHYWKLFGVGAELNYFHTSFDEGFDLDLLYIGPNVGVSVKFGEKWRYDATLSLGYGNYKESSGRLSYSEGGFAVRSALNLEYMFSKNIALGIKLSAFSMGLKEPDGYRGNKDEFYGIQKTDLLCGLRFYF